jgi:hypothetical protein
MKNGVPTGECEDFMVGFIADNGNAWGRPVSNGGQRRLAAHQRRRNLIYRI